MTATLVRTRDGDLAINTTCDPRCDGTGAIDGAGYDAVGRPRHCRPCRTRILREWDSRPRRGRRNR